MGAVACSSLSSLKVFCNFNSVVVLTENCIDNTESLRLELIISVKNYKPSTVSKEVYILVVFHLPQAAIYEVKYGSSEKFISHKLKGLSFLLFPLSWVPAGHKTFLY